MGGVNSGSVDKFDLSTM